MDICLGLYGGGPWEPRSSTMNEDVAAIYHIYIKWIEKIHLVCCPLNIKTMFKSSTTLMRSKVLMTHVTNPTALGERKGTAAYQFPCVCVCLSLHRKDKEAVEGLQCCMETTLWYKGKPAPMMPFLDTCGTQATTSSGPQHQ